MTAHRIVCIRKPDRFSTHEHITHVGYDGKLWSREYVISLIKAGTDSFYVYEDGYRSEVGVVTPDWPRQPYLRTYSDGEWNDNLLSLDECIVH